MARVQVMVIKFHNGFEIGDTGYVPSGFRADPNAGYRYNLNVAKTGNALVYNDMGSSQVFGDMVVRISGGTLKGSKEIKDIIDNLQERINFLGMIYKTGKPPVSPETIAKAEAILETVKAIKKNDEAAALAAVIKALE